MARPITLSTPLYETRENFVEKLVSAEKLKRASSEHPEALLEAYELLQLLHERGVLAMLRGALGAGDKLVNALAGAADSPQVIAALRSLIVLVKALAAIDPLVTRGLARAVDETMSVSTLAAEPPSLLSLLGQFHHPETRRGLALASHFLAALGRETGSVKSEQNASKPSRAA